MEKLFAVKAQTNEGWNPTGTSLYPSSFTPTSILPIYFPVSCHKNIYIYMYIYSCPPLTEQIAEFCVNLTSDLSVCQPALVFFPFFPLSATYIPDPTGNASCGDDWTYQIPFLTLHHCDTNSNFHWVKSFSKQDFEILKAKLVRQIKHVHDIRFHFVH